MRYVACAAFFCGCGYSSYWPDHPHHGGWDSGGEPVVEDIYHEPGTPPCSSNVTLDATQLQVINLATRELRVNTMDIATCTETAFLQLSSNGVWNGTVDPNLVFVVRGLDGGLVRWFDVPAGTYWTEELP